MSAESQPLPDARAFSWTATKRGYLEQRLFAYSPLNLWLTAAVVYFGLIGAYALAAVLDGATWIHRVGGGYALDGRARVAMIPALVICVALAMQRYAAAM